MSTSACSIYRWTLHLLISFVLVPFSKAQILPWQVPLFVKSTTLHTWLSAGNISTVNGSWPVFWNRYTLSWSSWIRVDGTSYQWIGNATTTRPQMTSNSITPTRSIFSFEAGPVAFNATYLSPVDTSDLVRLSLPFGYFYADVTSLDGNPHSVQFYFDVTGEILSRDLSANVRWGTSQSGNVVYHSMNVTSLQPTSGPIMDILNNGTLIFAIENRPGLSWQTGGADSVLRPAFTAGIPLNNSDDSNFRSITNDLPALAFRIDLGNITQTDSSLSWSVGVMRDPVLEMSLPIPGIPSPNRRSYYWSAYNSTDDVIGDVIGMFDDVRSKAIELDNYILNAGGNISSNLNDLLSLSLRMTFAAMEVTLPEGTLDTSDLQIFMRDIGGPIIGRVDLVATIYASLPAILYINATLAGPLLKPLLDFQNSSAYTTGFAAPDLGSTYPIVTGNPSTDADSTQQAIESSSSMLIMTWAHASKSGDGTLINGYYKLLKSWADYLELHTLNTNGYFNSDGESGSFFMSNLALKGILGMYAMGNISEVIGMSNDSLHYQSQAQNYTATWKSRAFSSGHITSIFEDSSSWGLIYNLYAAKLLNINIFSDQEYDQQSQFYASQSSSASSFGLPYDTRSNGIANTDWNLFTAATISNTSVRDSLIEMVRSRAAYDDGRPFPSTYLTTNGVYRVGEGSPSRGAMFAPLALSVPDRQITSAPPTSQTPVSKGKAIPIGAIAGGVVAGMIGLILVLGLTVFYRRKQKRNRIRNSLNANPFNAYVDVLEHRIFPTRKPSTVPASSKSVREMNLSTARISNARHLERTLGDTSSSNPDMMRMTVEQLQRDVEALRNERIVEMEPPPLYDQLILYHPRSSSQNLPTGVTMPNPPEEISQNMANTSTTGKINHL